MINPDEVRKGLLEQAVSEAVLVLVDRHPNISKEALEKSARSHILNGWGLRVDIYKGYVRNVLKHLVHLSEDALSQIKRNATENFRSSMLSIFGAAHVSDETADKLVRDYLIELAARDNL